jgi:hypothetical protein
MANTGNWLRTTHSSSRHGRTTGGFVVGQAYVREASFLMQTSLLPAAEKVYTGNLATVEED